MLVITYPLELSSSFFHTIVRNKKRIGIWISKLFFGIIILFFFITASQVIIIKYINPPFTVRIACDWVSHMLKSKRYVAQRYQWRNMEHISPFLRKAVLAGEDQRFVYHNGFDFIELNQAVKDIILAKRIRGASTITMQLSRTLFLLHGRSWQRKAAEAYYTVLLELFLGKMRILELYLNTIDWGVGIMGAEAASMKYFKTHADNITPEQAALLVAILPSPHRWSPTAPGKEVKMRQQRIMNDMYIMPLL